MSDEQRPGEKPAEAQPPAAPGMPVAGRKPAEPQQAGTPTADTPKADTDKADVPKADAAKAEPDFAGRPEIDGPTVKLTKPPELTRPAESAAALGSAHRETTPATEPDQLGGETRRLTRPPTGSPEPVKSTPAEKAESAAPGKKAAADPWKRLSSAGALIWVLLALFGFTLVVQLQSNDTDEGLASARQEDLVRILSDLEARDTRLQAEITALENSQRQLTSGVAGRQAALAEADKRAGELGLLAGTLPGQGPGLHISIDGVEASEILNAVQELRGAGGEVMQIAGSAGGAVRIVASSFFVDAEGGGIVADGTRLAGPYTLTVIGQPQTMQTALQIPGGVVASVNSDGGSVTMEQRQSVEVTAVRKATDLQYARPVS